MEIITNSGAVVVNKRTPYGKWLIGYTNSGAWSGWSTLDATWRKQKGNKPDGCSWEAWGFVCGKYINTLYRSDDPDEKDAPKKQVMNESESERVCLVITADKECLADYFKDLAEYLDSEDVNISAFEKYKERVVMKRIY